MTLRVRPIGTADLATWIAIKTAVTPDWSTTPEQVEWADRTYPGGIRLIAEVDDQAVGVASAGRIYVHPPDYPDWWAEIAVLPAFRRQGAGSALLAAISSPAREAGKTGFQLPVSEAWPDGMTFLANRGFTVLERNKSVRLDLEGAAIPLVRLPDGIRLATLEQRPDLVPGVHQVALATFDDIPGGDPMTAGDLAEFRARDVDQPGIRADGFFVALAGDDVVGYASTIVDLARPTVAFHDMTAVRREWRGRGIATALKAATIRWAAGAGLAALETGNDEANAAMRAVNARLGYRPLPDLLFYRGPLVG